MSRIYIAGALNGDACTYIKNLSRMLEYGEIIRSYGAYVFTPGSDFLNGIKNGNLDYKAYAENSMAWLEASDAVFITPKSEKSEGTKEEKRQAKRKNIPIFETLDGIKEFLNRPKILAIVGESGSGKTLVADYIEQKYGIPMVRSYTDREQRGPDDNSHKFMSREEFAEIDPKEKIVPVIFGENHYCCLHKDIYPLNSYVIEENGCMVLKNSFSDRYNIKTLRIHRNDALRLESIDKERFDRDEGKFLLPDSYFDYIIFNDGDIDNLKMKIDVIVQNFFNKEHMS